MQVTLPFVGTGNWSHDEATIILGDLWFSFFSISKNKIKKLTTKYKNIKIANLKASKNNLLCLKTS